MVNNVLAIVICFFSSFGVTAQINRYAVYLKDKANNEYSLAEPAEFLTERSLQRRSKNNVALDSTDLPVSKLYMDSLVSLGYDVYYPSKWLNAILVQTQQERVTSIKNLGFVSDVVLLAFGEKLSQSMDSALTPTNDIDPKSTKLSTSSQLKLIGADEMHRDGFTGKGVFVAVFDDGFPGVHTSSVFKTLFEENRLKYTWDFVVNEPNVYKSDDHGTQVLSCIAGNYNDKLVGTAHDADIALFRTEDINSEYRIEEFNWLIAAEKSDSLGVDIINSSVGYYSFDDPAMNYTYEDLDGDISLVTRAADLAASKGILVVSSAGNEGAKSWKHITVPADGDSVLAVGSVGLNKERSIFSSVGPTADGRIKPDVSALGSGVVSINGSGNMVSGSGTSFSAPIMAGFCATLMEIYPESTMFEIMTILKASGHKALNPNSEVGYGVPNYNLITSNSIISFEDEIDVYPNPFTNDKVFIRFRKDRPKGEFTLRLVDLKGEVLSFKRVKSYKKKEILEFEVQADKAGLYFLILDAYKLKKKVKLIKF